MVPFNSALTSRFLKFLGKGFEFLGQLLAYLGLNYIFFQSSYVAFLTAQRFEQETAHLEHVKLQYTSYCNWLCMVQYPIQPKWGWVNWFVSCPTGSVDTWSEFL